MKVLLTGASGFVGFHVTNRLARLGNEILAIDAKPPSFALPKSVHFCQADITSPRSLSHVVGDFDVIINLASLFSYSASRDLLLRVNVFGTENFMNRIRSLTAERIIHFSSASIYGFVPRNEQPIPETREPRPSNDYELSKWLQEKIVRRCSEELGLRLVIFRPGAIYGEGSKYGAFKVIRMYLEGKLWFIPGTGKVRPGLVSIDDVVGFLIHVLRNDSLTSGKTYNVSDDGLRTLEELMLQISEGVHIPPPKMKIPAPIVRLAAKTEEVMAKIRGREPEFTSSEAEYLLHDSILDNSAMKSTGYRLIVPDSSDGIAQILRHDRSL